MALKQTDLYKDILKIFQTKRMEPDPDNIGLFRPAPNTMLIFAKELSDAYDKYAKDSETYAGDSLASTGKKAMNSVLDTLEVTGNTPAFVALTISLSVVAYWGVSKYNIAPFPPGFSIVFTVITHPPTTPSFAGIQSAIISGGEDTIQANLWAAALHKQTLSVATTHIGLDTTVPVPLPKTESKKPIS
jgi:hypothetical protein